MDDLVAWYPWYREQLDDDERAARAALDIATPAGEWRWARISARSTRFVPCRPDPARALREIDAKWQILDAYAELGADRERLTDAAKHLAWTLLGNVVHTLAAAMDDRPGYRAEWRPGGPR